MHIDVTNYISCNDVKFEKIGVRDTSDYVYMNSYGTGHNVRKHEYYRFGSWKGEESDEYDQWIVVLCFDLGTPQSWNFIKTSGLSENSGPNRVVLLVGTKCDQEKRNVPKEEIDEFCKTSGVEYMECSAKENINITQILPKALQQVVGLKSTIYWKMNTLKFLCGLVIKQNNIDYKNKLPKELCKFIKHL